MPSSSRVRMIWHPNREFSWSMGAMSSMSSSLEPKNICQHMQQSPNCWYSHRWGRCKIVTLTFPLVQAICQNEQRSHRHGMLSRPVMPHRLLNQTGTELKVKQSLSHFRIFQKKNTHLPDQFHVCEQDKGHYLQLWPWLESSGQTDLYTQHSP